MMSTKNSAKNRSQNPKVQVEFVQSDRSLEVDGDEQMEVQPLNHANVSLCNSYSSTNNLTEHKRHYEDGTLMSLSSDCFSKSKGAQNSTAADCKFETSSSTSAEKAETFEPVYDNGGQVKHKSACPYNHTDAPSSDKTVRIETGEVNTDTHRSFDHTSIDYQEIVQRLHKLGNEIVEDKPSSSREVNGVPNSSPNFTIEDIADNQLTEPEGNEHHSDSSVTKNIRHASQFTDETIMKDQFGISYIRYKSEHQMPDIMALISKDLSEPYSIYTYRYFIHNWPSLCFLAMKDSATVGAIVCKLDPHKRTIRQRGYIAMLAVDNSHRRKKIGSTLVGIAIEAMIEKKADEVVLETEVTNLSALHLYEKLGFVRDKRLYKYYLNGVDAFRLKLWLT